MNRTDRLLAIVLELQGRGHLRAQDLAEHFETSVRTIYRDVEALCEAGVPIVATPGRGYALLEGYFLPPLTFTAEEATTLLLGGDFVRGQFDPQYRDVSRGACRKIEAVLPARQREELQALRDSLHIITTNADSAAAPLVPQLLGTLRRAILDRRVVRFHYHGRHADDAHAALLERDADPYSLAHVAGVWHLIAYCHQRRALRKFRLDRMERLVVTAEAFTRPADFRLPEEPRDDRRVTIRALFAGETARWVRESRYFYIVAQEETPGGLLVTLRVRREEEAVAWLLGWGAQVRVLEPLSLRARLAAEAEAMLAHYREVAPRS